MRRQVQSLASLNEAQWVEDPAFLWLWCRLTVIALFPPLAWELPYAAGVGLKRPKKKKKKRERRRKEAKWLTYCKKTFPAEESADTPEMFKEQEGGQGGWHGASGR